MKLKIKRTFFADAYTIGKLFIDGVYYCDTIEDKNRDLNRDGDLNDKGEAKVYAQTAIPFGTYVVTVTRSPKFGRDLPRLLTVPHFDGILIHRGNTAEDSAGCIIVGENKIKGKVINSAQYELGLTSALKEAIRKGESISITIE